LENILDGIYIFIVGMGVLFITLGLLILVIRLLDVLFRPREERKKITAEEVVKAGSGEDAVEKEKLAAALAVGMLLLGLDEEVEMDPSLGLVLEEQRGRYWSEK
jgi:sodium pump decarboxylase gamma subunit